LSGKSFDLTGKLALVTGGGTGLGFAIAQAFSEHGAEVVITGRRKEVLQAASESLGNRLICIQNDVSDLDSLPGLVSDVSSRFQPIDILVNNSGLHLKKALFEVSSEEFRQIVRVNQEAVFALSREVARGMEKRRKGSIIMISSMAARYGIPKVIAYTASKAAVEGMTRAMAVELSPFGVRVNCIAPGFIATPMSSGALEQDSERKRRVLERTPLGRLGQPEDVGHAAVFLASDAADYITGAILPVDGGNSIGF
jgi:NAD(P)-dependent dehydrogenase (short-subunit alcohol dehydrogenase family)